VSTGPYKIAEPWHPGRGLTLERYDGYYRQNEAFDDGGAGHLRILDFRIYDELGDAYVDWHVGALDVTKVPPARIREALAHGESFRRTPCALMQYVGLPTALPPFDDPRVRRAVALCIDRRAIIDSAFSGTRPVANRILPPGIGPQDGEDDLTGVTYDPEQARKLLAEAGVTTTVRLDFRFNAGLGHDAWVQQVVDALNTHLGWQISPRPTPWPEFLRWLPDADSLFRMTWAIDYPSVDNFLYPLFHSESIGKDNFSRYLSPEFDRLVTAARGTADPQDRRALYEQAESLVCADLPIVPLWFGVQYHLVNRRDFDVSATPIDIFGEPVLRQYRPHDR
jgi:oligopeptide transport system substrate-binding protein